MYFFHFLLLYVFFVFVFFFYKAHVTYYLLYHDIVR